MGRSRRRVYPRAQREDIKEAHHGRSTLQVKGVDEKEYTEREVIGECMYEEWLDEDFFEDDENGENTKTLEVTIQLVIVNDSQDGSSSPKPYS